MGTRDQALYEWLAECAAQRKPCPHNADINVRFAPRGSPNSGYANSALDRLKNHGFIQVVPTTSRGRQIRINATGLVTAPSLRKPSKIAAPVDEALVAKVLELWRAGEKQREIAAAAGLSMKRVRMIIEASREWLDARKPRKERAPGHGQQRAEQSAGIMRRFTSPQLGFIGPSSTCRWIDPPGVPLTEELRQRAFAGDESIYCGKCSVPGRSWCGEHLKRVMARHA